MLEIYKNEGFLKGYLSLPLNDRINTKYIDFRAEAWGWFRDLGEDGDYLKSLLHKIDRNDHANCYL